MEAIPHMADAQYKCGLINMGVMSGDDIFCGMKACYSPINCTNSNLPEAYNIFIYEDIISYLFFAFVF
jgi:hypothetical protein